MQHLVKFFDDPLSAAPVELEFVFAHSFEEAMDKAKSRMARLRAEYVNMAGYRIEEVPSGRTVMIGPGKYDDA
jgi:hypothetical protein